MGIKSILLCMFLSVSFETETQANSHSSENIYREIGYQSVTKAVREFENSFSVAVNLPTRLPPVEFTHCFGRFNDLEGDVNDNLEVTFISERFPENHYKIDIRPKTSKIKVSANQVVKTVGLTEGQNGTFIRVPGFDVLVFEKDNWQYILSIDKRISQQGTDLLVKIAESLD
jgi:hypothetical protein